MLITENAPQGGLLQNHYFAILVLSVAAVQEVMAQCGTAAFLVDPVGAISGKTPSILLGSEVTRCLVKVLDML